MKNLIVNKTPEGFRSGDAMSGLSLDRGNLWAALFSSEVNSGLSKIKYGFKIVQRIGQGSSAACAEHSLIVKISMISLRLSGYSHP